MRVKVCDLSRCVCRLRSLSSCSGEEAVCGRLWAGRHDASSPRVAARYASLPSLPRLHDHALTPRDLHLTPALLYRTNFSPSSRVPPLLTSHPSRPLVSLAHVEGDVEVSALLLSAGADPRLVEDACSLPHSTPPSQGTCTGTSGALLVCENAPVVVVEEGATLVRRAGSSALLLVLQKAVALAVPLKDDAHHTPWTDLVRVKGRSLLLGSLSN